MSLINELKRRNVFRVGTAYVVVAWLVLQVADVVLDFAEAPAWIGKVLIALLAIGLLIAIVLSWLFDATPDGIRRDDGTSQVDPVRAQRLNIITVAAALGVLGMFVWQQVRAPTETQGPTAANGPGATQSAGGTAGNADQSVAPDPIEVIEAIADASIAVLPFADLSPRGDQEYFSDGIAEEILNVLTRVEGLAVASRTSAFAFKGQEETGIPAIGKALGVRHVLEGSVRSSGNTIRVTAQLIDAATDKHLWSETYDNTLSAETVFAIQDEIANAIVEALAARLPLGMAASDDMVVRADTGDLDAYQLFLQGRQRFRMRSVANIPGTIDVLRQAVTLDPEFARAWAGYAAILSVAPSWGYPGGDGAESYAEMAVAAANRAIELDDSLALPYSVLAANTRTVVPRDFARSFDLYGQALQRDPNEVNALLWRGIDYLATGFFDLAVKDFQRCQALDPDYENCAAFQVQALLFGGDYAAARKLYYKAASVNAESQSPMFAYAMAQREEPLTAMLALSWATRGFGGVPIKPEFLYRAIAEPGYDVERGWRKQVSQQVALNGEEIEEVMLHMLGSLPMILLGRYEEVRLSPYNMMWWHTSFPGFLASERRKELIQELGISDYWRQRGFPPQCRPIGNDDFECDDIVTSL
ncbi:MAG: hypothetical protein AAF270_06990 [Pseudomonadota bacterium]